MPNKNIDMSYMSGVTNRPALRAVYGEIPCVFSISTVAVEVCCDIKINWLGEQANNCIYGLKLNVQL